MALILNIDTALDKASVTLATGPTLLQSAINKDTRDQAAWLHPAIEKMLKDNGRSLQQLDAVAVTIGPGSYTGLRIGLATAKGLCYALGKPLIALPTLELMARAVRKEADEYICPSVDARRMEIFTAMYDKQMAAILPPQALIINEESFSEELNKARVLFTGNGAKKLQPVIRHANARFTAHTYTPEDICLFSNELMLAGTFADMAYEQPFYIKEFFNSQPS